MKRRIRLALILAVALVVIFAGFGLILFTYRASVVQSEKQLSKTAMTIGAAELAHPGLTAVIIRIARVDGAFLRGVSPQGTIRPPLPLVIPTGIATQALGSPNNPITWHQGSKVIVALDVPLGPAVVRPGVKSVLVVLIRVVKIQPKSILYLLLIAGAGIGGASIAAESISSRITRPLKELQGATRRIASGDLRYRIPLDSENYPEIADLATSVNKMAEALDRSRQLERQFLMAISHDLRTPLTSISGFSEAILDGTTDDPRAAAIVIQRESKRLESMVQDLLELSRLQARHFSLDITRVDVASVVTEVAEVFSLRAAEAGLEFEFEELPDTRMAELDPNRLTQILQNLLENAYKFSKGRVYLKASDGDDNDVVVVVGDDGPGIPESDREKVFISAHRNERIASRTAGTGVGLLVVAELANSMRLKVGFKSPIGPEGGTEMALVIPLESTE